MKLFITMLFVIVAMTINAQAYKVYSATVDTVKGAETVSFDLGKITGNWENVIVQGKLTQLGGTTDGTITLYGSIDGTNYVFINGVGADVITASPKASITGADLNQITMTNGLVPSWVIRKNPYPYLRVTCVGTSGDTTKVALKYMYK